MKYLVTGLFLTFLASGCASEFDISNSDVPAAVMFSFQSKYPGITASEWEVEKEQGKLVFEAEFKRDGKSVEAEFSPDGTFVREE